ncbi:MAG: ATP synthase F1 subunit epsilon [Candidatus Gracilibacteria bacterium]|nr:ATP synthase F1 subunit epsilon [Candidatus Gracilibacteria bacterium]
MKLTLTSIKKKILEINDLEQAIIPTMAGEITVLASHVPIISALRPGILKLRFNDGKEEKFAIGGGVLETDGKTISIIADMVEDGAGLDIEEIKKKKEEAKRLMSEISSSGKITDMERYIEIELEFLKESAKERLTIG